MTTRPTTWAYFCRAAGVATALAVLSDCDSSKPAHYYVLCDGKDSLGWTLVDSQKDNNGYLIACTYQSPDKEQVRTDVCTSTGCD